LWKTSPPIVPRRRGLFGELRREGDVHHAHGGAHADWKAALAEDSQHAVVVRHYFRRECPDPRRRRSGGQVAEKDRAQAHALHGVGDC
jgi:hypothetical protein